MKQEPNNFNRSILDAITSIGEASRTIIDFQIRHSSQIREAVISSQKLMDSIPRQMFDISKILRNFDKAGLTPNLGDNASINKLNSYNKLLAGGYSIFWVPRADIINSLLECRTESERKNVVLLNEQNIITDCETALLNVNKVYLKDYRAHLQSAIEAVKQKNYRSAQSSASICIDALFNELVDTESLSTYRHMSRKILNDSKKLKTIDDVPVNILYGALQAQLLIYSLRPFNRLNTNSIHTKFSRHSSIHTVSSRQYSTFNTLQSIQIATSLIATTEKLGKSWLSKIADVI